MLIFASAMSNINSTSLSEDAASVSSVGTTKFVHDFASLCPLLSSLSPPLDDHQHQQQNNIKKKRSLPGNPDPDAEVVALSPKTLLATNRFVCEVCNKGFKRDQNLQLHRRGHNLPWKLKQRSSKEMKKKAYVCPEPSCVHHHPCRALGDLTGIKKHFCRKHGDKKWKCNKCSKLYAVQSDWKAHSKTCGTREYTCNSCGTLFSRKSSFITHRAFCEALAEESARVVSNIVNAQSNLHHFPLQNHQEPSNHIFTNFTTQHESLSNLTNSWYPPPQNSNPSQNPPPQIKPKPLHQNPNPNFNEGFMITSNGATSAHLSATVAASATTAQQYDQLSNNVGVGFGFGEVVGRFSPEFLGVSTWKKTERLTRDFLGLAGAGSGNIHHRHGSVNVSVNVRDVLNFTEGVEFQTYDGFGFAEHAASETWGDY